MFEYRRGLKLSEKAGENFMTVKGEYQTVAENNDEEIRVILEWRRIRGSFSSPFKKKHLCDLLEYRKKYRSDDGFPVWKFKYPPQGEPDFHW